MKAKTQELLKQVNENHDLVEYKQSSILNMRQAQCRLCGLVIEDMASVEGEPLTKFNHATQQISLLEAAKCPPVHTRPIPRTSDEPS